MSIPEGIAAKLNRAEQHVDDLKMAVDEFFATNPFDADRTVSDDGHEHILRWTRTTEIPTRIPLIAGDAAHNLRSALDHLAVAIERAGARALDHELTQGEARKPQFPVALTGDDFTKQTRRYFQFASRESVDVILAFQPCSLTTDEPRNSILYQVSELDNTDKHRALPITPITPVVVGGRWQSSEADWIPGPSLPFAPGIEIGRYRFAEATGPENADLEFHFGLTIVTDPWMPHDIRYRFDEFVATIRDGVVAPICQQVEL